MKNVIVELSDSCFSYWSKNAFEAGFDDISHFLTDFLETIYGYDFEVDFDE